MLIREAQFVCSNVDYKKCPQTQSPEFAFIGRSNVGKSSLINMLCGIKGLAKTSSTPGKTQCINHFSVNNGQCFWVDLPGYGYARISQKERAKWQEMKSLYLSYRANLQCVFVLIDGRIPAQKSDVEFINSLGEIGVPFCLVITKTDKESALVVQKNLSTLKKALLVQWESLPSIILSSALNGTGKVEILAMMEQCITGLQDE